MDATCNDRYLHLSTWIHVVSTILRQKRHHPGQTQPHATRPAPNSIDPASLVCKMQSPRLLFYPTVPNPTQPPTQRTPSHIFNPPKPSSAVQYAELTDNCNAHTPAPIPDDAFTAKRPATPYPREALQPTHHQSPCTPYPRHASTSHENASILLCLLQALPSHAHKTQAPSLFILICFR
jgi:hypothetical protein